MLLAALVSLVAALGSHLAALRASGLGTIGFTVVWGPGSCEIIGFRMVSGLRGSESIGSALVWNPPEREVLWTWVCSGSG